MAADAKLLADAKVLEEGRSVAGVKMLDLIETRRDELVELTRELIRFPTINPPGEAYQPCAEFIGRRLESKGFHVDYVHAVGTPGDDARHPRINVIARREGVSAGPTVHFNSHIDVVQTGSGWTLDPFAGVVKDGKVYGRGACDMKGGLASSIIAVEALIESHPDFPGALEISGTVDEESGGYGGVHYLAERGWFSPPRVDHVIIPEPLNVDRVCIGHRGVWWAEIETRGRMAHGSMPFLGDCAIRHMHAFIERMERDLYPRLALRRTDMPVVPTGARSSTLNINSIHGGQAESSGYPTPCVADSCRMVIDRRLLIEEDMDDVKDEVRQLLEQLARERDGFHYNLRDIFEVRPSMTDRDGPVARSTAAAIRRVIGRQPEFICSPGTYDQKHIDRIGKLRDCIAYGPGILDLAHQPDEYVVIDDMVNSAKVMALAAAALLLAGMAQGRVVVGIQLEPPILDPTASPAAAITECLYGNLYEGLVQFARDGSVLPSLAESWEISQDGLVYVFHLAHGVRFHDGSGFDAAAAKFSLDRVLDAKSVNAQRSQLRAIRAVEALDPYTLRISLSRRSGGLLQSLALGAFVMVSPQSAPGNAVQPVGTGPYRFAAWRRGDSLTLERNPDFRGPAPALDEVTFKFIAEPTAAFAALMAGDVDAFANYPAPESFAQFAADPRFAVFNGTTEMEVVLGLNERVAALSDLRVRRAISYALDRHAIIDGAMFGYGTPIGSHFPPANPAYVDLTGVYPHDPVKSKALLAEAGYARGLSLSLKLPPPSYARRGGEIIAAQLAQVGIKVEIENLEWAQWLDQVYTRHDFDMSIVGHAEPLDYDIYARDGYYFGYSNGDFNGLIAALDDTVDADKRSELLKSIQRKLADDAVNGFLFQYPRLDVWNKNLVGIGFDNVLNTIDLSSAHYQSPGTARDAVARGAAARDGNQRTVLLVWSLLAALGFAWLVIMTARRLGAAYLARRLGVLAATLAVATAVVFLVVQVAPGDPVRYMMGLQADPGAVASMRHELGLDAAPLARYLHWVGGLLHADFGSSYTYRVPIRELLAERLQLSLPLAVYAVALTCALAFPVGMLSAARRGRFTDAALSGLTQVGLALPNFWLGMLLVLLFAVSLHWVSAGGFPGWQAGWWPALRALTLPAIALAMPQAAILARVLRGALIDTLQEDYVRTARAKGAGEWQVLWRHALPNALVPVLTILGMQFSFLLAGGVIIENVFFLPGLGRLVFQAIVQRDLIVVQSVVIVLVFAVVSVSFVVDIAYSLINPQLREAGGT